MQRVAFVMQIKPGSEAEYYARHQQVWPELLADLKEAGCHNYSIYRHGLQLFAYLELEDLARFLAKMASSEADKRWQARMSDILEREVESETDFPALLPEMFHLD